LAAIQIVDQALSRIRYSTQGRLVAELAVVRISQLEELDELSSLIAALEGGSEAGPKAGHPCGGVPRQATAPSLDSPGTASPASGPLLELTGENAIEVWSRALARLSGLAAQHARHFDHVTALGQDRLSVSFKPAYTLAKSVCERPEQVARFEAALAEVCGHPVRVEFRLSQQQEDDREAEAAARPVSPQKRLLEVVKNPMVHRATELFGAEPSRVDDPAKR
jgi:DNA polymerase-3 subunit gamma/tau